jgi:hypothetical protein
MQHEFQRMKLMTENQDSDFALPPTMTQKQHMRENLSSESFASPRGSPARMHSSGNVMSLPGGSPPSSPQRSSMQPTIMQNEQKVQTNLNQLDEIKLMKTSNEDMRLTVESVSTPHQFSSRIRGPSQQSMPASSKSAQNHDEPHYDDRQPLLNQRQHLS